MELVGLLVGDGHWQRIVKGHSYLGGRISYASKDRELAEWAGILMGEVFGKNEPYVPYWSGSNRVYVVESCSKQLLEVLENWREELRSQIWLHRVRLLKGIFDAEGSINVGIKGGRLYPRIFLTNSDAELIDLVRKALDSIGIGSTLELNTKAGKTKEILGVPTKTNRTVFNVCIGRIADVARFANSIGFRIIRKQELLQKTVLEINRHGTLGSSLALSRLSSR